MKQYSLEQIQSIRPTISQLSSHFYRHIQNIKAQEALELRKSVMQESRVNELNLLKEQK